MRISKRDRGIRHRNTFGRWMSAHNDSQTYIRRTLVTYFAWFLLTFTTIPLWVQKRGPIWISYWVSTFYTRIQQDFLLNKQYRNSVIFRCRVIPRVNHHEVLIVTAKIFRVKTLQYENFPIYGNRILHRSNSLAAPDAGVLRTRGA